jgi:hypothetical protein
MPGADEVAVAGAVNDLLRARFGLAVDTDRVRVLEEPVPRPPDPDNVAEPVDPADVVEAADTFAPATSRQPPWTAVREPHLPQVHLARPGRLTIQRVQMQTAGLGVVATVQLGLEGAVHEGTAEGAATVTGVNRSVATATLGAVESVIGGRARFEVEHLEVAISGRDRTALVVLSMLTGRSNERLSGASVVREDIRQAVVRAVLAAVNRRLEPMLDET